MAKVQSVAERQRGAAAKVKAKGPTIMVRALRQGFYGYPLAKTWEVGQEFPMYLSDMNEYIKPKEGEADKRTWLGKPFELVKHGGKTYELPSWVTDAKNSRVEEDEEDAGDGTSTLEEM